MADVKISGLPASTVPLAGTEVLPIVQSSTTKKVSIANVTAGRAVSALSFAPTGSALPVNGLFLPDTNAVGISTNSEERARFFATGGVSIGNTVDPGATNLSVTGSVYAATKLSVGTSTTTYGVITAYATSNPVLALTDATLGNSYGGAVKGYGAAGLGGHAELGVLDNGTYTKGILIGEQSVYVAFYTGSSAGASTEKLRVDASGNVLIGRTTNSATAIGNTFGLASSGLGYNESVSTDATGTLALWYVNRQSSIGTVYEFRQATTTVGSITVSASATLYNVTSDYRLKNVIGAVNDAGQRLDALEPIEYDFKTGGRTRGFLAHQFAEVYPNSVSGKKDAVDAEGKPVYQAMQASSSEVMADLIAEIQSLRKRLTALEAK